MHIMHVVSNLGLNALLYCVVGTVGQMIPLITNFFKLQADGQWNLYQYHVDFNPHLESKRLRIALLHSHAEILGGTRAFDGMVLFMPKKLPQEVGLINTLLYLFKTMQHFLFNWAKFCQPRKIILLVYGFKCILIL